MNYTSVCLFQNSELNQLASEARTMKDELDILRHVSDQVSKYESTIDSYKKKLGELFFFNFIFLC